MIFEIPAPARIRQLRDLWKEAFGDDDRFLDQFRETGFSPRRCRCLSEEGRVRGALYWFDGDCGGEKFAYLYAVAVRKQDRGRGVGRALLARTHRELARLGYGGAILAPASDPLFDYYRASGYRPGPGVTEFSCEASEPAAVLKELTPEQYGLLRRTMLPAGALVQEGPSLAFLATQCRLLAGENVLLAADITGETLTAQEFLGDRALAPGILRALGCSRGVFRTPGQERAFSMWIPLKESCPMPAYLGLTFD